MEQELKVKILAQTSLISHVRTSFCLEKNSILVACTNFNEVYTHTKSQNGLQMENEIYMFMQKQFSNQSCRMSSFSYR